MSDVDRYDGGFPGKRLFGLYPAIVTDIVDPEGLGRVQVSFPWLGEAGRDVRAWARLVTPYADDDQGLEILPEVDSEVAVSFEAGNVDRPYVIGAVWNGRAALPEAPAAANNKRVLKTRAGSRLEFDDSAGAARVTLSMASGHTLVLDDAAQQVSVRHANGCEILMTAAGQVRITANATVEISAATVNVHAAATNCDGIVRCATLITDAVVSASYTPGAGNVW